MSVFEVVIKVISVTQPSTEAATVAGKFLMRWATNQPYSWSGDVPKDSF